jgi:mannan endo-1,4-beta-mannosidase
MLEVGRLVHGLVEVFEPPGRWLFVKIVVLIFCLTAVGRIMPWKPRRSKRNKKKSKPALVARYGAAAALLACGVTGATVVVSRADTAFVTYEHRPPHAVLATSVSSYLGVYEPGVPSSFRPVRAFAQATRTRPRVVLYYSAWGSPFQAAFAHAAYQAHAITLIQLMPTSPGVSLAAIVSGKYDHYLDAFAQAVRSFRHGIIIGFAPEMNGNWWPYGYGNAAPATWVAAWRHIVDIFRANGADNVTWLWTVNKIFRGSGPLTQYWPGKKYVTWVGIDAYFVPSEHQFGKVIAPTLAAVRRITSDPVIISETGIAPKAGRVRTLRQLFAGVRADGLLGFVYFDANQANAADYQYRWRLEDSPAAVAEYSRLARRRQRAVAVRP